MSSMSATRGSVLPQLAPQVGRPDSVTREAAPRLMETTQGAVAAEVFLRGVSLSREGS